VPATAALVLASPEEPVVETGGVGGVAAGCEAAGSEAGGGGATDSEPCGAGGTAMASAPEAASRAEGVGPAPPESSVRLQAVTVSPAAISATKGKTQRRLFGEVRMGLL
jgi:hypothetical protein